MNTTPATPLDSGTRLAVERTRLAYERTMMAWVRTAISLISFGFTIYKFFEFEFGRGLSAPRSLFTPRQFGMTMIGIGLIALLLGAADQRRSLRLLRAEHGDAVPRSTAGLIATVVAAFGLLAFTAALFRG